MSYRLTIEFDYDEETQSLSVEDFTVDAELLSIISVKKIGAALCAVGSDCFMGRVHIHRDDH